ncbi:MAG: hypothetical protein JWO00_276 [Candidatus Parcubacteria bacterium]|nr:hypothetical protein [Candidatus Parcubacteria bacterium]
MAFHSLILKRKETPYLEQPFPLYFLLGLILVNLIAIFKFDPFYIGSFFAFFYVIITPGLLVLPFLIHKKFPPMLGIAISAALGILILMLAGLVINTMLPLMGLDEPLTTIPLLVMFDVIVYFALVCNYEFNKLLPFEFKNLNAFNWSIVGASLLTPLFACIGAIILNNQGSSLFATLVLALPVVLVPIIVWKKTGIDPNVPAIVLYLIALGFLLTNSMRGWYISGHDILLEYHVFSVTNAAHLWNMAFYRDPYMACLSLTILPSFLQQVLHISPEYIFKFFMQFLGAFPVVVIFYLAKEYVSEKIAFLVAFLYISFPTFLIDMAFLNRQGIAFLFFSILLLFIMTKKYAKGPQRMTALFLFGIGIIISHYSTSYVAIAMLVGTYIINRVARFIVTTKWPAWLQRLMNKLPNRDMYDKPILISFLFTFGMLALMLVWSTLVTKTSTSFFNTIQQIIVTVERPFSLEESSGQANYSLLQQKNKTPQQLFDEFRADGIKQVQVKEHLSEFYPIAITESYPAIAIAETPTPLTSFGEKIQSIVRVNLTYLFAVIKQLYAKIIQVFLLIGLLGLVLGFSFKKNILRKVPVEYLALSTAGLCMIVAQTILPASAIDYGLLRLLQQTLIFLSLPTILGLILLTSLVTYTPKRQLISSTCVILFFFIILSGLFPQLTGGARYPLPLDNAGLYYDSYFTHGEEVASIQWLAQNGDHSLPIQAAHFSDMKMLAFGKIGAYIELLPETTKKRSYVYFNYDNTKTNNILEIVNGNVVYYQFPTIFLDRYKSLIYSNGGSKIFR